MVWALSVLWTLIEMANPEHQSAALALIGFRSYWLWWVAPIIIATVLQNPAQKRRAILVLSVLTIGISILAAIQFVSPPDSAVNLYSVVDGEEVHAADTGIVFSTGRARVSSTFSFLSGFQDFTLLIPTLLLSLGLSTKDRRLRTSALLATLAAAAVVPMSGSRASVILGAMVLLLTTWSAGLFFTVTGRRVMIGAIAGLVLATAAFPDAILGVQSRFDPEETQDRFLDSASFLPPIALYMYDYPMMGIGTGMQQNARASMHVDTEWWSEYEPQRYLVELGVVGFCLVSVTKFGIVAALWRCHTILRRSGRRAAGAAALSYAALTFFGYLTFDHIWQALFFVGCGFILAETISALESGTPVPGAPKALALDAGR